VVPKIADFGLAARLDGGDRLTRRAVGTPAYLAPEQLTGRAAAAGPATDIYSLGVLLYECLTGRAPFAGLGPADLLFQVSLRDPPPPGAGRPGLPEALDRVCLRCLHKEPARRYAAAAALADDLAASRLASRPGER
jgi:serine/threonine protein kinase